MAHSLKNVHVHNITFICSKQDDSSLDAVENIRKRWTENGMNSDIMNSEIT